VVAEDAEDADARCTNVARQCWCGDTAVETALRLSETERRGLTEVVTPSKGASISAFDSAVGAALAGDATDDEDGPGPVGGRALEEPEREPQPGADPGPDPVLGRAPELGTAPEPEPAP
jgi:hypothetical protein